MLNNLHNKDKSYLNRSLYLRSIKNRSELDRYIEKYFLKNNKITNYNTNLTSSQEKIVEYFGDILSEKLEMLCDHNEDIDIISWDTITSTGINIIYDHLVENKMYVTGIHPAINSFITLFEKIKKYNPKIIALTVFSYGILSGPQYCNCENANYSQHCNSICSILALSIAIVLIEKKLEEDESGESINVCGKKIIFEE